MNFSENFIRKRMIKFTKISYCKTSNYLNKALKAISQGNVNVKPVAVSNSTASSGRFKMDLQMFAKKSGNENLVQIEYENGYLIDLSWYPE